MHKKTSLIRLFWNRVRHIVEVPEKHVRIEREFRLAVRSDRRRVAQLLLFIYIYIYINI